MIVFFLSIVSKYFRVPLSTRCNSNNTIAGAGPGSEYSLPPSYRAQHQHTSSTTSSRPPPPLPPSISLPLNGENDGDGGGVELVNNTIQLHESRSSISLENTLVERQQQEQHQKQQHDQQSIISRTDSSPNILLNQQYSQDNYTPYQQDQLQFHHNVLVDVVNDTKISHISEHNKHNSTTTTIECPNNTITATAELQPNLDRFFRKSSSESGDESGGNSFTPRKDLVTIVTISGCTETESSTGEMDILAHL